MPRAGARLSWAAVGAGVAEAGGETLRLQRKGARTRGQADEPGRGSEALSSPGLLHAPGPGPRAELGARPCPLPGPVPTFLPAPPLAHPPPRPAPHVSSGHRSGQSGLRPLGDHRKSPRFIRVFFTVALTASSLSGRSRRAAVRGSVWPAVPSSCRRGTLVPAERCPWG